MTLLGLSPLTYSQLNDIIFAHGTASIAPDAMTNIARHYDFIASHANNEKPIYGLNTGFGALAEQRISSDDRAALQKNIILSHAVGVGAPLDFYSAKTLMLLRLNTLAQGYSGASPALLNNLLALVNQNCAPVVPRQGSVGASGDLAPLAHLGLLLLGIGDAYVDHRLVSAQEALSHAGIKPLQLGIRDGLALINGTQAMASVGFVALKKAHQLSHLADICAATSLDALAGHEHAFDERVHQLKPHAGQIYTAQIIRALIAGRTVAQQNFNKRTQDPYSLRCVPQVHGATKDIIAYSEDLLEREINAITDNPLFFIDYDRAHLNVVSGGNFHGQHLALMLDYLAMGIAELANISERRLELLVNPHQSNGLPPFLTPNSGLNSGFMMLHVTTSALVNENKVLCHPASTDSIPTSAGREDHVSMGMTAANKLIRVIENTQTVLAIEFLASHQALDLRPLMAGEAIQTIHNAFRKEVSFRHEDGLYKDDLSKTIQWLNHSSTLDLLFGVTK